MEVIAKKTLYHDKLGTIMKGRVFDAPEKWGKVWLRDGAVEHYQTKVIRELPLEIAGQEASSSVSQAAQVSPKKTLKKSGVGATRKRKKSGAS